MERDAAKPNWVDKIFLNLAFAFVALCTLVGAYHVVTGGIDFIRSLSQ